MGSSQSQEVQRENGEEVAVPVSDAPEASTSSTAKQQESSVQGVKRKRRDSGKEEPRRKKKKHSMSPISEAQDNAAVASEDDHGDKILADVEIPESLPQQPNGKLTPVRKKRKKSRPQKPSPTSDVEDEDIPAPDAEDDDIYTIGRDSEASLRSEEEKPLVSKAIKKDLACQVCGREFNNKKHLERHMANPKIHERRHKCRLCDKKFYRLADLRRHQSDADHKNTNAPRVGQSRGAFTEKEKAKLNRFKQRFCDDHAVSEFEFNNLMTLMGRRKLNSDWPNPDITMSELRDMFYSVLPDRSRKSLNRYRERYFQNVEQDTTWTEDQINELSELVKEKGSKWVEIAELLGRTQDSVYQKWKNRVRQGDAQRFERWEEDERQELIVAVQECKEAAGVASDFSSDDKVNWTAVSDRLGGRRNAQQCATYWKRVYRPREEAIARGEEVKPLHQGRNKSEPTKSRIQSRRRATRGGESVDVITPRRKVKSSAYITQSDEEEVSGQKDKSKLSKGRKGRRSGRVSLTSDEIEQPEQDSTGAQNAGPDQQQQSRGDPEEAVNENAVTESPSKKKHKKKRLIDAMTSSPAVLRDAPNLQRSPTRQPNSSFQAVNRQQQPSSVSPRLNRRRPASTSHISVVIPSPRVHETPRLPTPPPPPPPPRSARTPRQVTSLTQAFDNTQAPTSARTAGRTTPGMHLIEEERPSPDIEIRLSPVRNGRSRHSQLDENADDDAVEQQVEESAMPSQPDFEVYDSGADNSDDDGEPPQMFSSGNLLDRLTDTLTGAESEVESDTEAPDFDDEEPPQMFSSAAPIDDAEESAGTEFDAESGNENVEQEDAADSEAGYADDDQPPQMFSSAAPEDLPTPVTEKSEVEEVDDEDDQPPPMFSSTMPGMEEIKSPGIEPESESEPEPDTEEESEEEATGDQEDEVDDEDEDEPPQMFTSTIPGTNIQRDTNNLNSIPSFQSQSAYHPHLAPTSTGTLSSTHPNNNNKTTAPPNHQHHHPYSHRRSPSAISSTSSGDAATIPPYASSEEESAGENDSGEIDSDSDSNSNASMLKATTNDFFANLEAEAKRVRRGMQRQGQKPGYGFGQGEVGMGVVNGQVQGMDKGGDKKVKAKRKRKGIYDISSSEDN